VYKGHSSSCRERDNETYFGKYCIVILYSLMQVHCSSNIPVRKSQMVFTVHNSEHLLESNVAAKVTRRKIMIL